ncbi:hypothetical protein [Streptomyces sp. NRRL S-475]|uniref:hypothetical protein n=1 Tax=Streptomyces sp. NRRL S-475 TaxID=1463910 RepID=UPI00131DF992|nr:hypothetical protein [Streptomyces sp. NRRL S-475]
MGIRTFLSRTAPGVALPPVPAFEAAASTVRVPVTFTSALRHTTADLRQRLATRGRRPTGSAGTGALTAATVLPGTDDPAAAPALADTDALAALTGLADADALAALTALAGPDALAALAGVIGVDRTLTVSGPTAGIGDAPTEARPPCTPEPPGKPSHPWARLARDYLALVLALLPRPRLAHTTITVYITTTDSALNGRPGGSAPSRRQGQDRRGPEPDAAP